jgi:hypothetical protein
MTYIRPLLSGAVLMVLLTSTAATARAAGEIATRISIGPLETLVVGSEASVLVTLAQENGVPVIDQPIALSIDGDSRARRWTDSAGVAAFRLPRDLPPGDHEVVATFAGRTNAYLGATARMVVDIVPYELLIETVPSLPGMVFEIDGARFEAGADGIARVGLDSLGEHTVTALPSEYRDPDRRVEFSRWSNETFGPTINIRAPLGVSLQAGFDVLYQASLNFMDPHGNPVDQDRIEEVTLRNSIGATITNANGRAAWYKAIRTIRRPAGLDSVPIRYTVEGVLVDGENVVNVGQQRFDVEPGAAWPIELLLYSVRMVPNDALFGFPLGESVILTYPSGTTTRIDAVDGEFAAHDLARGLYRVQVADAPGWSPVIPIALSRDQEVRVRVITYLDVAVVLLLGISVALGLLHIGRPHLAPAAMAGAKGVVGVARSPRTIGAFLARRSEPRYAPVPQRIPASGSVPIAHVIRMTVGSPLPASRAEASALPPRPPVLPGPPAVDAPMLSAQPVRLVLASSMPPPVEADVGSVGTALAGAAAVAATADAASLAASTGDERRTSKRTRTKGTATPKRPPITKTRRTKAAPPKPAPTAGEAVTQKRRRSARTSPDASNVSEGTTKPRARTPKGAKAPKRRTSASTTADAPPPRQHDEGVVAPAAVLTSVGSTLVGGEPARATSRKSPDHAVARPHSARQIAKACGAPRKRTGAAPGGTGVRPSKPRSAAKTGAGVRPSKPRSGKRDAGLPVTANAGPAVGVSDTLPIRDPRRPPPPPEQTAIAHAAKGASTVRRPSMARSAKVAAQPPDMMPDSALPGASVSETAPPLLPAEQSSFATAETAADQRSKSRSARKAAAGVQPAKRSPKKAATGAERAKRSPKKAAAETQPPKRSSKKAAAETQPPKRSSKKAAAETQPPKVAAPPEVTATVAAHDARSNPPVRDARALRAPADQAHGASAATVEQIAPVTAADGTSDAGSLGSDPVSTDSTPIAVERLVDGGPSRIRQLPAEHGPGKPFELMASIAHELPRVPARSDRLERPGVGAPDCAGCDATLRPGARFCRRCGHVTAVGELERERMS